MHKVALSPSCLLVLAILAGAPFPTHAATGFPLVSRNATWRFLDDGSALASAWRDPGFDDSEWKEGPAELGYGDGDEVTTVDYGPSEASKHITTFFRHAFELTNPEAVTNLTLGLLRDDGAVVYLNGLEVFRSNMPAGQITHLTPALSAVNGDPELTFFPVTLSTALLLPGRNVVAAEVHQSSADSSDLSFNLDLTAIGTNDPPSVTIVSPPNNAFIDQEGPLLITTKAIDLEGAVVRVEFYDGNVKLGEVDQPPFDLVWSNAFPGSHALTAVATDDSGLMRRSVPARILVGSSLAPGATLVSAGATWKYWDNGTDYGTAWRLAGFDDQLWLSHAGEFGYGDGDENTILKFGPNPNNKHVTTYFRHAFDVPSLEGINGLRLRLLRDDGAVVYLNGLEIFRGNMPAGPLTYQTPALRAIDEPEENYFFSVVLPPSVLVQGANLLAVELHQADPATSDAGFDLELQTVFSPAVTRGPWLQNATPNAVTVKWNTDISTTAVVRYGTNPANLDLSAAAAFSGQRHEVRLTDLAPGTTYHYSVGNQQRPIAAGPGFSFQTPPTPGSTQPVRIWVLGDSGTATVDAQNVRNAYLREAAGRRTDVWLMLGDNAYYTGTDVEYQTAVFDMYPSLLRNTPLWSTLGNHDTAFSSSPPLNIPYFEIFTLPQGIEGGGVPSGTERYYSFDHGNIHFVCLDSMTSWRSAAGPMANWLEDDLAATLQPWVIAFWHHAPYTRGNHDSDHETEHIEMRSSILPILEAHGVDLVLSGHTHSYERSMLLHGHHGPSGTLADTMIVDAGSGSPLESGAYTKLPNADPERGAVFVVAGSGGKTSGGLLNHPAMHISLNRLGSVIIDVEDARLDLRMLRENGEIGDAFTILKEHALFISDATVTEPAEGTALARFEIALSAPLADPVEISYTTEPGMALPGADYVPAAGLITLPPGTTNVSLDVQVRGDALVESNETFYVNLATSAPVPLAKARGTATILDDEPRPLLSVDPVAHTEGHQGTTGATLTLRLSAPSEQTLRVTVATEAGSALAGEDYLATNGVVTFPPRTLERTFVVGILGDTHGEPDESLHLRLGEPLHVTLAGPLAPILIGNDDGSPPAIRAADVQIPEGDGSFSLLQIPIALSHPSALPVSAQIATRDSTATAGPDYSARMGPISFLPGATNFILRLFIFGNLLPEADEVFHIDFSNPINAALQQESINVAILNDDGAPLVIESIRAEGGVVTLQWAARPGITYRVERASSLGGAAWEQVGPDMVAEADVAGISDVMDGSPKFYRVMEVGQ